MRVGERIKEMRTAAGINQNALADYLEVDQSLISKIEKGEREASTDFIRKVANLFGCSTTAFFDENIVPEGLSIAFRAKGLNCNDLKSIATINRIALNLEFMEKITEGQNEEY